MYDFQVKEMVEGINKIQERNNVKDIRVRLQLDGKAINVTYCDEIVYNVWGIVILNKNGVKVNTYNMTMINSCKEEYNEKENKIILTLYL